MGWGATKLNMAGCAYPHLAAMHGKSTVMLQHDRLWAHLLGRLGSGGGPRRRRQACRERVRQASAHAGSSLGSQGSVRRSRKPSPSPHPWAPRCQTSRRRARPRGCPRQSRRTAARRTRSARQSRPLAGPRPQARPPWPGRAQGPAPGRGGCCVARRGGLRGWRRLARCGGVPGSAGGGAQLRSCGTCRLIWAAGGGSGRGALSGLKLIASGGRPGAQGTSRSPCGPC